MRYEVHHLEAVELLRDFLDAQLLVVGYDFDVFCVPADVLARCWHVLAIGLGAAGGLAGVGVELDWAGHCPWDSDDMLKQLLAVSSLCSRPAPGSTLTNFRLTLDQDTKATEDAPSPME